MKVLLIVPAYNEEGSIPFVLNDLRDVEGDILVVNDGSSDGTAEVAVRGGASVVTHPFNVGIGGTVQTGLRYALRKGYDFAVQFDGDGQHRADQIRLITEMVADGRADLVIGARTAESGYRYGVCRFAGSRLLAAITRLLSGRKITDPTSGFRCYGKEAIRIFARYYPDDYPEVETIVMAARNGLRVEEVPVLMRQRVAGSSSITPRKSVYYMLKVSLALVIDMLRRPSLESEEVC